MLTWLISYLLISVVIIAVSYIYRRATGKLPSQQNKEDE